MNILVISDAWTPQINGVVRTYQHLSRALSETGHNMDVLGPSDCPHSVALPFYSEIRLGLFSKKLLKDALLSGKYQKVHIATEGPMGWVARKLCQRHDIPFTTCYHTHFPDYIAGNFQGFMAWARPIVTKAVVSFLCTFHAPSKSVIVATPTLQKQLQTWGFRNDFTQMARGVDTSVFYEAPANLFDDLQKPVALYVGRVSGEKNIEAFLDATWQGSKVVVGDGPILDQLRAQYPNVTFTGSKQKKDLADHFRSASIFVFPSKTDTFGMVNIEALACGLPVAAYPVQGPIDILKCPQDGAMNDDLSVAMQQALKATGTREERSARARTTYTWDQVAKDFLSAQVNYG